MDGEAFQDGCGACVGGDTGLTACTEDCHGELGGTAYVDDCGACVGGDTSLTACTESSVAPRTSMTAAPASAATPA